MGRDRSFVLMNIDDNNFYSHAPRGARPNFPNHPCGISISTHTPLVGRDRMSGCCVLFLIISTHTPLVGRDAIRNYYGMKTKISTHTPLVGRDYDALPPHRRHDISTHTPLVGRDYNAGGKGKQ